LDLTNSSFEKVGHDKRNKYDAAVSIYGVQLAEMYDLYFKDSKRMNLHLMVGEPVIRLTGYPSKVAKLLRRYDRGWI